MGLALGCGDDSLTKEQTKNSVAGGDGVDVETVDLIGDVEEENHVQTKTESEKSTDCENTEEVKEAALHTVGKPVIFNTLTIPPSPDSVQKDKSGAMHSDKETPEKNKEEAPQNN